MRILITGGAGFIGSHLTDSLLQAGHEVTIFDNLSTGNIRNLNQALKNDNCRIIQGDILDGYQVKKSLEDIDYCFHFAAAVGVDLILKNPIVSMRTNVHGSENVMQEACDLGVPVLFASTSEIYGKNSAELLNEDSDRIIGSPTLWRWSYSDAKALDEALATALAKMYNFQVKTIRYFNTVGPRQSEFYGMVIPNFVKAAIFGRDLKIYGDGSQRRVFCHIEDAIDGTLSLWRQPTGFGEVFNLGGLEEISILELAKMVIQITNSSSQIEFIPYEQLRKSGYEDIPRRRPNIEKISSAANWRPVRGINQIIVDYVNYYLESNNAKHL